MKFFHGAPVLLLLLLSSCSSPKRDNPFDPLSPDFKGCTIEGNVYHLYNNCPIEGATVLVNEQQCVTDRNGYFCFDNLLPGEYSIVTLKEGYQPDTQFVILNGAEKHVLIRLNGLPSFVNPRVITMHIWSPVHGGDIFLLFLSTYVEDPDGIYDISRVFSVFLDDTVELEYNSDSSYSCYIPEDSIPYGDIRSLEGVPIFFHAIDNTGAHSISDRTFISRIIEEIPFPVSPANGETIRLPVSFVWESAPLPYTFHHKLEVYMITGGPDYLILEVDSIPSESTSFHYDAELQSGFYYWTVWYVDEYGNMSRSREALFYVR